MDIRNSSIQDIDAIFELYGMASAHQKAQKTVVVWPDFDRDMVATEIAENRQWKLVIDGQIACVWATTFSDAQIWEKRNADPAVYIHRIATNTAFRGRNLVATIVLWARQYAQAAGKKFIRLDTIGNNTKLIDLYVRAGFTFLGLYQLTNTSDLPAHYQSGLPACLFEIALHP
jgi:ribosomal protein S18 acetylase RimI-like enzyme